MYREAVLSDIPAICTLMEDMNGVHHQARPKVFADRGDPQRHAELWQRSIEATDSVVIVSEAEGKVIGFVSISICDETYILLKPVRYGQVGSLSVSTESRGRGIGRELMARAEQWAIQRGAADIQLMVWAFNEAALHLYKELGYEYRGHILGRATSIGTSPEAPAK